jgi:stress-induced morphogen
VSESIAARIERKLNDGLEPVHLEILNESGMHAAGPDAETHFRLLVVSEEFEGKPLVQRHRLVYGLLEQERADGVHALAMRTMTPAEFGADPSPGESPACMGGHD